jgi:hypothetical protein
MNEKPKKSVRMWVARDKDNELYLYRDKPTNRFRPVSICKMGRQRTYKSNC